MAQVYDNIFIQIIDHGIVISLKGIQIYNSISKETKDSQNLEYTTHGWPPGFPKCLPRSI